METVARAITIRMVLLVTETKLLRVESIGLNELLKLDFELRIDFWHGCWNYNSEPLKIEIMKKSLLIVALAFTGSAVMAQQAPADENTTAAKPGLVGKKLDIKVGVQADTKTVENSSSLWVPVGEANKSGKKNMKLDVKAVKQ